MAESMAIPTRPMMPSTITTESASDASTGGILFVSYGGGHIDIAARVLRALERTINEQAAPLKTRLLALTTAGPAAARLGIAHHGCANYLPAPGYEDAERIGAKLSIPLWQADSGISWQESCAYMGVSMCDLIAELGLEAARAAYDEQGRAAFCPRRFIGHVLDRERPALVVTTCNVRMERAANLEARRRSIRSVRLEDLFGYSILGPYTTERPPVLADPQEWPDDLVVMNTSVAEKVVVHGFPSSRVQVLGQPVLADWARAQAKTEVAPTLTDWATADAPVIVYVAPPDPAVLSVHGLAFRALAVNRPDLRICIKLHPSSSVDAFLALCPGALPKGLRVLASEDINTVIRAANLTVVMNSTAGLLAAMSGKPMLVLDTSGQAEVIPYVASGVARRVEHLEALEGAITAALEQNTALDTHQKSNQLPELFQSVPEAADRIAAWLNTQVSEHVAVGTRA